MIQQSTETRLRCSQCGHEGSPDDFYRDPRTTRGYRYSCKTCDRARSIARAAEQKADRRRRRHNVRTNVEDLLWIDGRWWQLPSLAERLGHGRKAVGMALRQLQADGWVESRQIPSSTRGPGYLEWRSTRKRYPQ